MIERFFTFLVLCMIISFFLPDTIIDQSERIVSNSLDTLEQQTRPNTSPELQPGAGDVVRQTEMVIFNACKDQSEYRFEDETSKYVISCYNPYQLDK